MTGGYQTLSFGITSITRVSTLATVTAYGKHGLDDGQIVAIAGAGETEYNGSVTIAVASPTTFTYAVSGTPSTPASGTITYNENVSVKFTLPFGHTTDDEYAFAETVNQSDGTVRVWRHHVNRYSGVINVYISPKHVRYGEGALGKAIRTEFSYNGICKGAK